MDTPLALPTGFTARPCAMGDVRPVFELVAACELHDIGVTDIELDDIESEWAQPSFDLDADTIAVVEDATGNIVAQGEVTIGTRADCCVHPDRRRRGIGTWMLRWTQDHARSLGAPRIGQTVADTALDAIELFERNGYMWLWTSWILDIQFGDAQLEPPTLPEGYAIRDFVQEVDGRAVHAVIDRAFLEWSDREPEPFEDWNVKTLARAGFQPWLLPVAIAPDGEIVGAAFLMDAPESNEGWVQQLAVAREHRGIGLGRALLDESFVRFHARGRRGCGVNTDSRTGALGLYEHAGMSVKRSYTHRALHFTDTD